MISCAPTADGQTDGMGGDGGAGAKVNNDSSSLQSEGKRDDVLFSAPDELLVLSAL